MAEKNELVVIEPANALVLFTEGQGLPDILADIRAKATSLVPDITTAKGRKEIASVAHAVARTKTYLDGLGKDLVDQYKEIPKRIDANRKQIRDELDKLKDEVRAPLTAYEDAERERTEALQARLDNIKLGGEMPVITPGATSEQLSQWLGQVTAIPLGDDWEERLSEATVAKETAINKLTSALAIRKQYEAEQTELERLRQEQAKRDQEERERQIAERARQQEAERQLQERAEAQRRELAAQQQAEQARRDAELAEQRRIEAEASAKRQAEEAASKAAEQERQRIAAEQQAEMAAQAKREADTEHRRDINNRIIGDLMIECDVDPDQARKIAEAIVRGKISNVSVNY